MCYWPFNTGSSPRFYSQRQAIGAGENTQPARYVDGHRNRLGEDVVAVGLAVE